MGGVEKALEVVEVTVGLTDVVVVADVVAIVAQGAGVEGQRPDGRYAKLFEVVEFLFQSGKVTDTVTVGVEEAFDVEFVDDGILIP